MRRLGRMALSEPLIIAGTQPGLIRIASIALELKRLRVRLEFLYAGQHCDHGLSQTLIAELGLTDLDRLSVSDEAILYDVDRLRSNVRGGNVSADREAGRSDEGSNNGHKEKRQGKTTRKEEMCPSQTDNCQNTPIESCPVRGEEAASRR